MSIINRLTTWVSGQILTSSALNNEFNNIVNLLNNLDAGTTSWTNVKSSGINGNGGKITNVASGTVSGDVLVWGQSFTAGNITFSPTTSGIVGTTTNNNATAGNVGEYVSSSVGISTVNLTSNVAANITSISLTAGDWDVTGNVVFSPSGTASYTILYGASNSTSATLPAFNLYAGFAGSAQIPQSIIGVPICTQRYSLSGTTTIFLVANAVFAVSTITAGGLIQARRVR